MRKKKALEQTLQEIRDDFMVSAFHAFSDSGGHAPLVHSPVPAYIEQCESICGQIKTLVKVAADELIEIQKVIDLLPEGSDEWLVLTYKYIMRKNAYEIADEIPCGYVTVYRILDRAIDQLLELENVTYILNRFSRTLKDEIE
jgi:ATP-dependent exoDNAse (exonuclease V) beta subunit